VCYIQCAVTDGMNFRGLEKDDFYRENKHLLLLLITKTKEKKVVADKSQMKIKMTQHTQ